VETKLDLGDRSEWIRVERDPALYELHNRDVGILCGWLNFGRKSCVIASLILIYIMTTIRHLKMLHMNLFDHIAYISIGGNKYGLVIIDDYSRFTWVFVLQDKSET
jgi:hypothetical protein